MNVIIPFPGSPRTPEINENSNEVRVSLDNWADHPDDDAARCDLATVTLERTKGLVDAACKAFFTKRGMSPDGYRQNRRFED